MLLDAAETTSIVVVEPSKLVKLGIVGNYSQYILRVNRAFIPLDTELMYHLAVTAPVTVKELEKGGTAAKVDTVFRTIH